MGLLSWIHEWFTGARRKAAEAQSAQWAQWIEDRKGCQCARCRMRRGDGSRTGRGEAMDPNVTWEALGDALRAGDFDAAREHAEALEKWIQRDGFLPLGASLHYASDKEGRMRLDDHLYGLRALLQAL